MNKTVLMPLPMPAMLPLQMMLAMMLLGHPAANMTMLQTREQMMPMMISVMMVLVMLRAWEPMTMTSIIMIRSAKILATK